MAPNDPNQKQRRHRCGWRAVAWCAAAAAAATALRLALRRLPGPTSLPPPHDASQHDDRTEAEPGYLAAFRRGRADWHDLFYDWKALKLDDATGREAVRRQQLDSLLPVVRHYGVDHGPLRAAAACAWRGAGLPRQ